MARSIRRRTAASALACAMVFAISPARAEKPPAHLAFLTGAGTLVLGMAVGGVLLSTSHGENTQDNAGWLTMESTFAIAPLAAHGVTSEWGRGLAFAGVPIVSTGVTAEIFK